MAVAYGIADEPIMTSAKDFDFQLGTDALVSQFAGFATGYFKPAAHPLDNTNRGTLFLPFEAKLGGGMPMRIVVAAINGPDMPISRAGVQFKAIAHSRQDGNIKTKFGRVESGRGSHDHMKAFNTLEMLMEKDPTSQTGAIISPDNLCIRPIAFPCDMIPTDTVPNEIPAFGTAYSTRFKVYATRCANFG